MRAEPLEVLMRTRTKPPQMQTCEHMTRAVKGVCVCGIRSGTEGRNKADKLHPLTRYFPVGKRCGPMDKKPKSEQKNARFLLDPSEISARFALILHEERKVREIFASLLNSGFLSFDYSIKAR